MLYRIVVLYRIVILFFIIMPCFIVMLNNRIVANHTLYAFKQNLRLNTFLLDLVIVYLAYFS